MYKHSRDADIVPLSIFDTPPTNTSVKTSHWVTEQSNGKLSGDSIKFKFDGNTGKYLDLEKTRLYLKCQIIPTKEKPDTPPTGGGTSENEEYVAGDVPPPDSAVPINHLLRTMWKSVEVTVDKTVISSGTDDFAYKSLIKTLLYSCHDQGSVNRMNTELFYPDTNGHPDSIYISDGMNNGVYSRREYVTIGEEFEMEGSLNECSLNLDKYLINGLDVTIRLTRTTDEFMLNTNAPERKYTLKIKDAKMRMRMMDVGPSIITGHDSGLKEGGMAQYFFRQSHIHHFTLSQGDRSACQTIFTGDLPNRIVVAMIEERRHLGNYTLNPLHFDTFNCEHMSLVLNNTDRTHEYHMDFKNKAYAMPYSALMALGPNAVIDYTAFRDDYPLFVFDVYPNDDDTDLLLQKTGSIRLELTLAEEAKRAIHVMVYAEFQNCFQVDHVRKVIFSPLKT